jgi:hypothetical protein
MPISELGELLSLSVGRAIGKLNVLYLFQKAKAPNSLLEGPVADAT